MPAGHAIAMALGNGNGKTEEGGREGAGRRCNGDVVKVNAMVAVVAVSCRKRKKNKRRIAIVPSADLHCHFGHSFALFF